MKIESNLAYPLLAKFFQEEGLKKTLRAFKREVKWDGETVDAPDLLLLIERHTMHLQSSDQTKQPHKRKRKEVEEVMTSVDEINQGEELPKKKKKIDKVSKAFSKGLQKIMKTKKPSLSKKHKKQKRKEKEIKVQEEEQEEINIKEKKEEQGERINEEVTIETEEMKEHIQKSPDQDTFDELQDTPTVLKKDTKTKKTAIPFKRITSENTKFENDAVKNNAYWAKGGDYWGTKAHRDFAVVKGKNYRHEKTKKKRGSYRGGNLDLGINSIKFDE